MYRNEVRTVQSRPNILLIMADQHRADCLGAYGNSEIRTPHLDALAQDGVVFDRSFCPAPVCTPSRYSLLTGLYPHQHMGWSNHSTLPRGTETFPRLLQRVGYRTRAVGKMHLTPTYLDVGFEEMLLAEQNGDGRYEDDYHRYLKQHGLVDTVDLWDQVTEFRARAPQAYWDSFGAMESTLPEEHESTTWIGNAALQTLDSWSGGGNLLMVSFIKPHHPFDPPAPWSRMYDPAKLTVLPGWIDHCLPQDLALHQGFFPHEGLTIPALRRVMAYYYATISQIDSHVGRMVERLKAKGSYENTLIIYTSDHGDYMGFHHLLLKQNYMYDPLARVPLIMKFPGGRHRGTRHTGLVTNPDITATVIAQAGCRPGEFMQGHDLSELPAGRDVVFAEESRGRQYMLRSQYRKLLLCRDDGLSQFFDLEKDPYEMRNLIHDSTYREEVRTYKDRLAKLLLFEAPSPMYVDTTSPQVRSRAGEPSIREWIRGQME